MFGAHYTVSKSLTEEIEKSKQIITESEIGTIVGSEDSAIKKEVLSRLEVGDDSEIREQKSVAEAIKNLDVGIPVIVTDGKGKITAAYSVTKKLAFVKDEKGGMSPLKNTKTDIRGFLKIDFDNGRKVYAVTKSITASDIREKRRKEQFDSKGYKKSSEKYEAMAQEFIRGKMIPLFKQKVKELDAVFDKIDALGGAAISHKDNEAIYKEARSLAGGLSNAIDKLFNTRFVRPEKWKEQTVKELQDVRKYFDWVFEKWV